MNYIKDWPQPDPTTYFPINRDLEMTGEVTYERSNPIFIDSETGERFIRLKHLKERNRCEREAHVDPAYQQLTALLLAGTGVCDVCPVIQHEEDFFSREMTWEDLAFLVKKSVPKEKNTDLLVYFLGFRDHDHSIPREHNMVPSREGQCGKEKMVLLDLEAKVFIHQIVDFQDLRVDFRVLKHYIKNPMKLPDEWRFDAPYNLILAHQKISYLETHISYDFFFAAHKKCFPNAKETKCDEEFQKLQKRLQFAKKAIEEHHLWELVLWPEIKNRINKRLRSWKAQWSKKNILRRLNRTLRS